MKRGSGCNLLQFAIFCFSLAFFASFIFAQNISGYQDSGQPNRAEMNRSVDSLLGEMTLEEKLGQLSLFRGKWQDSGPVVRDEYLPLIKEGRVGSFLGIYGAEYTKKVQDMAKESRLGIPILFGHDVIHGFRTIFPVPLAEASSWDPEAVERTARIAAIEATATGLHWTFAPMVDIARDPRWGRIVEGSGEDPYLGSVMAAARVRGFQGENLLEYDTMLACAKHFVAYGGAEGGRDYNTVDISERTLREVYLPPFHAAVKAGVASVMGAFNEIGGVPMHASHFLMTEVLREEWGFDGFVVSDFTAILEMLNHGVAATREEAGILALQAGVDMEMEGGIYNDLVPVAKEGSLSEEVVNESVRRVLRAKYEIGLFEDAARYCDPEREKEMILTPEHLAAARDMARKSIVLLKNEKGVLPLSKNMGTLAIIGPFADDPRSPLGSWAAAGRAEDVVTVLKGVEQAVSPQTKVVYAKGCEVQDADTSGFAEAVQVATQADAVIMVVGEHADMSGEAASRASISLPGVQEELVKAILQTGKPLVVVLMNGRPLDLTWLSENVPAILESWFLGVQMGPAVADVLFGDTNPGGKLPVTFPRAVGQIPKYYNHKNTGRPPSDEEKWNSKYIDLPYTPLYPFGYGLSYTTFEYTNLRLSKSTLTQSDTLEVTVDLTNAGDRSGDEVVQLYIRDEVGSITRPVKELRGFQRIHLDSGKTKSVSFTLTPEDLKFYNIEMKKVVEPGWFKVFVGTNSRDVQEVRFEVVAE